MALRHLGILSLSLLLPAAFLACNQDSGNPSSPNPNPVDTNGVDTTQHASPPATLELFGPHSAQVNQTVSLAAIVKDSAGVILAGQTVTWSSSDSTLISVSANGVVTARRIGDAVLTAAAGNAQDTLRFSSSLSPYTFVFADTISSTDRQIIRDGIQYADAFHKSTLGRAVVESTTVSGIFSAAGCSSGGSAAYTGSGSVVFCLGNPGWKMNGPVRKQKIVQHELFHVWQFEYKWISNPATAGATWLIEGSAEWMGYKGVAARGLLSFETALGCQVKEAADFATRTPPGLPALSTVESRAAFQGTVGPLYTHSMLAAEYLAGSNGANSALAFRAYADSIKAGVAWQTSFQSAFGKSTATFYSQFPGYVSGLPVPASFLCGI